MFSEVQKEMSRFGKSVIKQSRSNLTRKGHNDTKDLYNSLDFELNVHKNSFSLSFYMAEYGAYQDQGVRGAYSNTRAPKSPFRYKRNKPIGGKPFEKWAKRKGISPWAVARSVWSKGMKPTMFFTKPFENAFLQLPEELIEQFGLDIDQFLEDTQFN